MCYAIKHRLKICETSVLLKYTSRAAVRQNQSRELDAFALTLHYLCPKKEMLVLLSCAKTMTEQPGTGQTEPLFRQEAERTASLLSRYGVDELGQILGVGTKIAAENRLRYLDFQVDGRKPTAALFGYTGIVFKRLRADDFSADDLQYAQEHLRLTSFLYGLLRPLDGIFLYRLEGGVRLPENGGQTMFDFWKPKLTDALIADTRKAGGVLCNLASGEMRNLFDWQRVEREVTVVSPEFKVQKAGKWATVTTYAKMMRGEMARFVLKHRVKAIEGLPAFASEDGFSYNPSLSDALHPVFTL